MEIKPEESEKVAEDIAYGIRQLKNPLSIKRIVLLVNSLDDMIKNAGTLSGISDRLDECFDASVVVKERASYERVEKRGGDYLVGLDRYNDGRFNLITD